MKPTTIFTLVSRWFLWNSIKVLTWYYVLREDPQQIHSHFQYFNLNNQELTTFNTVCLLFSCSVVSNSSATWWTIVHQAPLSMGFSRQEYQSGLPFPSPGDLPDQGSNSHLLYWQVDSLLLSHLRSIVCLDKRQHYSQLTWASRRMLPRWANMKKVKYIKSC